MKRGLTIKDIHILLAILSFGIAGLYTYYFDIVSIHDYLLGFSDRFLNNLNVRSLDNYGITQSVQSGIFLINIILFKISSFLKVGSDDSVFLTMSLVFGSYLLGGFFSFKKLFDIVAPGVLKKGDLLVILAVYLINLNIIILINNGVFYSPGFYIFYAIQPLLLALIIEYFNAKKVRNLLLLVLLLIICSTGIPYLFAFCFIIFIWLILFYKKCFFQNLTKNYGYLILSLVLFILGISYYLMPVVFDLYYNVSDATSSVLSSGGTAGLMQGGLSYVWYQYFSWILYTDRSPKNILTFSDYYLSQGYKILMMLFYGVLGCLTFFRKKKYTNYLFGFRLIVLLGIFGAKGIQSPGGNIYEYLLDKVPLFALLRTPDSKLGAIIMLGLSGVVGVILVSVEGYLKHIFRGFLIIYLLIIGYPLFNGEAIFGSKDLGKSSEFIRSLPKEYIVTSKVINSHSNLTNYNCLSYPGGFFTEYSLSGGYYIGIDLLGEMIDRPLITKYYNITNGGVKSDLDKIRGLNLNPEIFERLNIGCILIRKNIISSGSGSIEDFTEAVERTNLFAEEYEDTYTKIYFYTGKYVPALVSVENKPINSIIKNQTSINLIFNLNSQSNLLRFNQVFNDGRKLYPGRPIATGDCSKIEYYSGSQDQLENDLTTSGSIITSGDSYILTHVTTTGESLRSIVSGYGYTVDQLYPYNRGLSLYPALGEELQITIPTNLVLSGSILESRLVEQGNTDTQWGPTTECIRDSYTFFEGEELSYLWKQPLWDNTHEMIYDYANGWRIGLAQEAKNAEDTKKETYLDQGLREGRIVPSPSGEGGAAGGGSGSYNVSLTLYFRPQSRFYLGLLISGATFIGLIAWLLRDWRKSRTIKKLS